MEEASNTPNLFLGADKLAFNDESLRFAIVSKAASPPYPKTISEDPLSDWSLASEIILISPSPAILPSPLKYTFLWLLLGPIIILPSQYSCPEAETAKIWSPPAESTVDEPDPLFLILKLLDPLLLESINTITSPGAWIPRP